MQRLLGERLLYASWAIADTNDELGQRFWNELDVEVFDLPLADMVANLGAAVADRS